MGAPQNNPIGQWTRQSCCSASARANRRVGQFTAVQGNLSCQLFCHPRAICNKSCVLFCATIPSLRRHALLIYPSLNVYMYSLVCCPEPLELSVYIFSLLLLTCACPLLDLFAFRSRVRTNDTRSRFQCLEVRRERNLDYSLEQLERAPIESLEGKVKQ